MRLMALLVFAALSSPSAAQKISRPSTGPVQMDAVPEGRGWNCFEFRLSISDYGSSPCARAADRCEAVRSKMMKKIKWGDEFSECKERRRAAVFTYFDVGSERFDRMSFGKFYDCRAMRRTMLMLDPMDYSKVSRCRWVGARVSKSKPRIERTTHESYEDEDTLNPFDSH